MLMVIMLVVKWLESEICNSVQCKGPVTGSEGEIGTSVACKAADRLLVPSFHS